MILWPTVSEERAHALRGRAKSWRRDGIITAEELAAIEARTTTRWRTQGLVLSIVLFVATVQAVTALFVLCTLMDVPKGVVTAAIAIAVAEYLMQRFRFFGTGIESALWIGGLFAFIFGLPSQGKPEALLVFAAAAALAGARVRNAFFGAVGAVLVVGYFAWKFHASIPAAVAAVVIGAVAVAAMHVEWRRPSTDLLFSAIALATPAAGYVVALFASAADEKRLPLLFAPFGLLVFVLGLRARDRVMLVAGAIPLAAAIADAQQHLDWPAEVKLALAGIVLVAVAVTMSRALAGRARGFVVTKKSITAYDEAMKLTATVAAAPSHPAPPSAAAPVGDGGRFGGAGATGEY